MALFSKSNLLMFFKISKSHVLDLDKKIELPVQLVPIDLKKVTAQLFRLKFDNIFDRMNKKLQLKQSKNLTCQKHLQKKITHLYLNGKYLKHIPQQYKPADLLVIYLHDNEIYEITNLEKTINLMSLYLQKNRILKINNIDNLKMLKKLLLGHNSISVVEGLENMESLEELHLEKQILPPGNPLCFDPRSINGICNTLQVLNISHNRIEAITVLAPLKFLRILDVSHNMLTDLDELCTIFKNWFYLKKLWLNGNPLCKNRLYKELIIASVYSLEHFDGKDVTDNTRDFFKRFHEERVAQRLHQVENLSDKFKQLPNNYPMPVQKAVSLSVFKQSQEINDANMEIFDERNAVYIPWKLLPKPHSVSKLSLLGKQKQQILDRRQPVEVSDLKF